MPNQMALSDVKGRGDDHKAYLRPPMVRQVHPAPFCACARDGAVSSFGVCLVQMLCRQAGAQLKLA